MKNLLEEFEDFASRVINLNSEQHSFTLKVRINRAGITNAADGIVIVCKNS